MKKSDFYYDLPEELIAQTPLLQRDHSRLMTLDRKTGKVSHEHFYNIIDHLVPGDCLSSTIPASCPHGCTDKRPAAAAPPWKCCCWKT